MDTKERITAIDKLREGCAALMGEEGFLLFDLLLCGHTTPEQQVRFLEDARNRGHLGADFSPQRAGGAS